MRPNGFYEVAVALMSREGPGSPRSAISRAYYATYHTAVQALERIGVRPRRGPDAHEHLQALLSNSGDTGLAEAASKIGDLQSKRIAADYRLSDTSVEKQKTAKSYVNTARDLMVQIGTCFSDQQRAARVRNAISSWLQGGRSRGCGAR